MYARYVRSDINWYVKSVDIDCHCWDAAGPIDWGEKGLYATDCWNWDNIFEFDKSAGFVANASIANANARSNDCCW